MQFIGAKKRRSNKKEEEQLQEASQGDSIASVVAKRRRWIHTTRKAIQSQRQGKQKNQEWGQSKGEK